ncbi:MAG: thiosulfate oxidation carrier complex protein SoxZ [Lautropia sp.]|nr:thiosulfate oxidation carrier complex protein SoxZ [Lautropia sp.]
MSASTPPRIWVSNLNPKKGEQLRVRAQISHIMETGLRLNQDGSLRQRNIVTRFEARLGDALLFAWEPGPAMSRNPYIEFTFVARESAELKFMWEGDQGFNLEAQRSISVQ